LRRLEFFLKYVINSIPYFFKFNIIIDDSVHGIYFIDCFTEYFQKVIDRRQKLPRATIDKSIVPKSRSIIILRVFITMILIDIVMLY